MTGPFSQREYVEDRLLQRVKALLRMERHFRKTEITETLRRVFQRAFGSWRAPRVTDDDDNGLAGALVPRMPKPPVLSGAAAIAVPVEQHHGKT